MDFLENVRLALRSIRSNMLRAILTLMIIAFGIMALVGILTAIDSAIYSLSDNLSSLGANTFDVDPKQSRGRRGGVQERAGENFTFKQSMEFKERYDFPAHSSVSMNCTGSASIKYGDEKTNPNVSVFGIDENYLEAKGFELEVGRNFNYREIMNGGYIAIVGTDVVKTLFNGNAQKAIDQVISLGNIKLKIIGVLKTRGSSMNQSEDRRILIPLQTGKRYYGSDRTNYNILVAVNDATEIDNAIAEATGLLRNIRRLKAAEENDFEIVKSDSLIGIIKENTVYFRLAAVGIGLITLIGAAIGLMNIMLVSVTERTREIGICNAIGATRKSIMTQFLTEAVLISLMGGIFGIILGVLIGNIVTYLMGGNFLFPWVWITIAVITCTAVGLVSGLYPALKASRLDPIESLRYE
ncbi:MAG: ABC transporter permease [Saprospiraceae bacterium]|nr:ABC transporter permease [Saprospiraceae bacterium]